jgi:glycosyltransferase involved in cell wall biosynthesis
MGGRRACPYGAVGVSVVNDVLRLSLDASAVPANPVGAGRYTINVVEALGRRHDVTLDVWCRANDADRWRAVTRVDLDLAPGEGGGAATAVRAVAPGRRPQRLVWEQVRLPRLVARTEAQVHHSPHYTMPQRARVATVVTIHDLTFLDHPEWHERSKVRVFRRAITVASQRATALVCVSATTAERLKELCSPSGRVFVIPHGLDHGQFRPHEPQAGADGEILERLGVHPPYIVFVGTLEPRKAVPELVAAFDRVADTRDDVSLVVVGGSGWGLAAIETAIATARHGARIVRTGYVPDSAVPALLRGAAVAAYPSIEEGFGLPALEALACGTPLVTTRATAMAEVTGEAALLVGPGDARELADALEAQLAGGPEVDARRRSGIEQAGRYTWEICAERHVEAYRWAAHAYRDRGRGGPGVDR